MPATQIALKLDAFFQPPATDHAEELFAPKAWKAVEATLSDRKGKPYLRCLVRNKDVAAKPEEIVRQFWLYRLQHHYKYPHSRLAVEYPVTFGRDTSKRADIVVMDADRPTVPYVLVEVKKAKEKEGRDQLKSYAHATGAPLALWSNGEQAVAWHRKNPNYFVEIPDVPAAGQTIAELTEQPWTIETLLDFEKRREDDGLAARSLKDLILPLF